MDLHFVSASLRDTARLATTVARLIEPGSVLTVRGPLGSGKTAFIAFLGRALGVTSSLRSPSYVTLVAHRVAGRRISAFYHADLYRLRRLSPEDRAALHEAAGDRSGVTAIEWPERAPWLARSAALRLTISFGADRARRFALAGRLAPRLRPELGPRSWPAVSRGARRRRRPSARR